MNSAPPLPADPPRAAAAEVGADVLVRDTDPPRRPGSGWCWSRRSGCRAGCCASSSWRRITRGSNWWYCRSQANPRRRRHRHAGGLARACWPTRAAASSAQDWRRSKPSAATRASHSRLAIPRDLDTAVLRATVDALRPDLVLLVGRRIGPRPWAIARKWGCWEFDRQPHRCRSRRRRRCWRRSCGAKSPPPWNCSCTTSTVRRRRWWPAGARPVAPRPGPARTGVPADAGVADAVAAAVGQRRVAGAIATHRPPAAGVHAPTRLGAGVLTFARTLAFRLATRAARPGPTTRPGTSSFGMAPHRSARMRPTSASTQFLSAPGNQFWADPCAEVDAGRRFLFVEQWAQTDTKGVIACLELLPDAQVRAIGRRARPAVPSVLSAAVPLGGQWYLTVESGQDNCVSLYRAEAFPLRWQHVTNLVSGWGLSTRPCTTMTITGTCSPTSPRAAAAPAMSCSCSWPTAWTGPFRPHPANPIVSDVRRARPAGRLFQRDGRLIRPAQDCAPRYGAAVVFNEVLELSPTHYRERPLGRLDTRWASGLDGCHTYNEAVGIEVLDARGTPPAHSARLTGPRSAAGGRGAGDGQERRRLSERCRCWLKP